MTPKTAGAVALTAALLVAGAGVVAIVDAGKVADPGFTGPILVEGPVEPPKARAAQQALVFDGVDYRTIRFEKGKLDPEVQALLVQGTERDVADLAPSDPALAADVEPLGCRCGPGCTETLTDIDGKTSTRPWQPGTVLREGTWTEVAPGCVPHTCVALAGHPPATPKECLP